MFSINDYSEFNKRSVHEHDMRGYLADDFIGKENLTKSDVSWYTLPDDKHIFKTN